MNSASLACSGPGLGGVIVIFGIVFLPAAFLWFVFLIQNLSRRQDHQDSQSRGVTKKACVYASIVALVINTGIFFIIPLFCGYRHDTRPGLCQNNLRLIEYAKNVWADKNGKQPGDSVVEKEVNSFIKGGAPTCPEEGEYTYKAVGEDPVCSIGGEHTL